MTAGAARGVLRRAGELPAAFVLAYAIGFLAVAALVHFSGVWNVLANTRLLDLLARGGVIAFTDADQGLVQGIPDPSYYVASQESIDWELVLLAAALFIGVWVAKAIQFHGICRFLGLEGSTGEHARAWFYGHGINRLLPYDAGKVASASALEGDGADGARAAQAVFLSSVLTVIEVALVGFYALLAVGLGQWTSELFWATVILVVAYLMVRPDRAHAKAARRETLRAAREALTAVARRPATLARLLGLGVLSIVLVDFAAYALSQAFTTTVVVLNVEGDALLTAIVAGYVARLIQFTPGGLGQWEWGFAAALYVGGLGFPEAGTLAILMTALRYFTGGIVFGIVTTTYGVKTNLRRVLRVFREPAPVQAAGS